MLFGFASDSVFDKVNQSTNNEKTTWGSFQGACLVNASLKSCSGLYTWSHNIHHFQKILFVWFFILLQLNNDCLNSNNWQSDTIDWHYWQPIKLADLWILEKVWFFPITPQLSSSGWHAMVFADTANLLLWVWQGSSSVPPIQIKLFRFSPYMSKPTMLLVKSFPRR